jgi:phosphoribosyl 1,2-cyclic phosphodiesterase
VRLYFCGTRGSTPAPGPDFVRYGGHTSCVAVARDDDAVPTLILDAGTGLRQVTPLLAGRPFSGTILLTHLHWDHVHGLPFFRAGDTEGAATTLLLPEQEDGACAEAVLERGMSPPHFPIRPRDLRGAWTFGTLAPGHYATGGFEIEAREIPHKGGTTFGYRVSDGRSVLAYLPDHCPTLLGPGPDGWGEYHDAATTLAKDADVLVHDAFLLPEELPAEASFGHAAADYAVGLAVASGARHAMLFHHRPDRVDDELDRLGRRLAWAAVPVTVAAEKGILGL